MKAGIIVRLGSFWVGFHYSPFNKRYCVNLIPCVTFWFTLDGGNEPKEYM